MRLLPVILVLSACGDPGESTQGVAFRDGTDGDGQSGERGTIKITEVLWSGSVKDDGTWDASDVFVEVRNEGSRPMDLSGWQLVIEGPHTRTHRIPEMSKKLAVGEHFFFAAKSSGCFPEPDAVLSGLSFSYGDPIELTLLDRDDRLLEPVGALDMPPFAGGYDYVESRSMERVQLMFGAEGTSPTAWHFYTPAEVEVPNNDRIAEGCRVRTLASPGRPNSPDYSGATASGSLE